MDAVNKLGWEPFKLNLTETEKDWMIKLKLYQSSRFCTKFCEICLKDALLYFFCNHPNYEPQYLCNSDFKYFQSIASLFMFNSHISANKTLLCYKTIMTVLICLLRRSCTGLANMNEDILYCNLIPEQKHPCWCNFTLDT